MSALLKPHLRVALFGRLCALNFHTTSAAATSDGATAKSPTGHYDIIIGGGGMVGTTLLAALSCNKALADKKILLLEGAPQFKGFNPTGPYGNRVSAINNNSVELFKSIGAWQRMVTARVKPVKRMQVWDASSDAIIHFNDENFMHEVAYIIENDLILNSVYEELKEAKNPNLQITNQARIKSVRLPDETSSSCSEVSLENGATFTCDLLIGADGANSLVRRQMGVDVFSVDYKRMGLVATVTLNEADDNSVAWQRFLPTGPVALLPLNDNTSSVVWSTTVPHAKQLLAMNDAEFLDALNQAFFKTYPQSDLVVKALNGLNSLMGKNAEQYQYPPCASGVVEKSRATFPLGFLHASSYVSSGAALVGDAAHRIHPLAGQGVNLGFSDVRFLVEVLADAAYAGAKLGDKQYLLKYERKSLTTNVPILIGVHGLHNLYSTDFSPVVLLRSLGLQLTQNIPPLKNFFMKRAIG